MIKTKKQLLKLVKKYHIGNLPEFENDTLYYFLDEFYYDRGSALFQATRVLFDQEAIDLYNKLNFHKDFLDKL